MPATRIQLLLPWADLLPVRRVDDVRELADRHYSRQSVGAREFMPPGATLVLRDPLGQVVFGWVLNRRLLHHLPQRVGPAVV